ncbi:hypothetical protein Hanom_Chr14g01286921 [Helianthus anomalus]
MLTTEANHCIKHDCFCKPEATKLPPPCSREAVECSKYSHSFLILIVVNWCRKKKKLYA